MKPIRVINYWTVAVLALNMMFTSCSDKTATLPDEILADEYSHLVMNIPSAEIEGLVETKNAANLADRISFIWSETDTIGIFPTSGSQIYFSMAGGAGQQSASFDGGGWALKKGFEYFSYYPFVPDFYIEKDAVPMTFTGQVQTGNGNPAYANLGKYCYMVAKGVSDENTGSLYFNYKRIGILFRIRIPAVAGKYKSLVLSINDELIALSGTYNAIDIDQNIDSPVYGNEITLTFKDLVLEEDGTLVAFMMLPPFNALNQQVNYKLIMDDGTELVSSVCGKNYEKDKTYDNAPNFSVYPSLVAIDGNGGSAAIKVSAAANASYNVSSDADWLTVTHDSGQNTIIVAADANYLSPRTAQVVISETVNNKGTSVLLSNVITVRQGEYSPNSDVDGNNTEDLEENEGSWKFN